MNDCLFCKLINDEIPSQKIYEDNTVIAFLDITPVNPGHTLVIPKKHYVDIFDTPQNIWHSIMDTVQKLSPVIKKVLHADGINIEMNNERAAGQIISHTHVHIIPRFDDDGFKHWPGTPYSEGEWARTAEKIKKQLA